MKFWHHPQVKLHFIILVLGFTGILGAIISLPALGLVWYRTLIAFIVLFAFYKVKKQSLVIATKGLFQMLFAGAIIGAHWVTFFHSIKVSNVSVALACFSSTSLFASVLEPLFFKRKLVIYEVILGVIVIVGLLLIFKFESQYLEGIIYALISAFLDAVFTIQNGLLVKKYHSGVIATFEMLGGFIGVSVFLVITQQFNTDMLSWIPAAGSNYGDFIYSLEWNIIGIGLLAIVCTAYAFVVAVEVMKYLSPFTVCMSFNLEPVYAIVLALMFFGDKEHMTSGFYLGTVVILFTVLINGWLKTRHDKKLNLA